MEALILHKQSAMQVSNKHILCTRPIDQHLIDKCAIAGLPVTVIPFIEIQMIASKELKQQVKQLSQLNLNIVFTSKNAVKGITNLLDEIPADWKIFCIGGITKESVVDFFGEDKIEATAKNASLLSKKIIEKSGLKEVIFFCGDSRLDDLPETLRTNNIKVQQIICYHTVQTPKELQEDYDAILFFSPTAAHSFFSSNTIRTDVVLFSIGKTTTSTIKTYCTNTVVTSEWPGQESLVEKVFEYYKV
jgi:uroporphyrinogen-III synthase